MKRAVILIYEQAHVTELVRVARLLKGESNLTPALLLCRPLILPERVMKVCFDEHIQCFDGEGNPINISSLASKIVESKSISEKEKTSTATQLYDIPKSTSTYPLVHLIFSVLRATRSQFRRLITPPMLIARTIKILSARYRGILCTLDELRANVLIMAEDNVSFDTAFWVRAGHNRGIKTLIIPFTIPNIIEQLDSAFNDPEMEISSIEKKITGSLYPKWVMKYKGKHLLRLFWAEIIARQWLNLSPPSPWMLNSGSADAIAVESNKMKEVYLSAGFSDDQLKVIGSLSDDIMAETIKAKSIYRLKVIEDLDLNSTLPILLIALPPDQFPHKCEFKDYQEILNQFSQIVSSLGNWNIIIRPHPKLANMSVALTSMFGHRVTWRDTASLIPICSIFIACASATIRWAIACGIPAINYDVYQYNYKDYEGATGVLYANRRETFLRALKDLTSNDLYYKNIQQAQHLVMRDWGNLDGRAAQRLMALINQFSK